MVQTTITSQKMGYKYYHSKNRDNNHPANTDYHAYILIEIVYNCTPIQNKKKGIEVSQN